MTSAECILRGAPLPPSAWFVPGIWRRVLARVRISPHTRAVQIVRAVTLAEVQAAEPLFDEPVDPQAADHFLGQPGHHLLVASVDGLPAGFVSGVETTHPDKGTEMFLYELGVAEPFRRQGVGTALVCALADVARSRGCYGMWVLTDDSNCAARATYRRAGATQTTHQLMASWDFRVDSPALDG